MLNGSIYIITLSSTLFADKAIVFKKGAATAANTCFLADGRGISCPPARAHTVGPEAFSMR